MTIGAINQAILRLRLTRPVAWRNQANGLTSANTRTVGTSSRRTGAAPIHFGPSNMRTISSAKSAQLIVTGIVTEMTTAYPFRNDRLRRSGSPWMLDSAGNATVFSDEL